LNFNVLAILSLVVVDNISRMNTIVLSMSDQHSEHNFKLTKFVNKNNIVIDSSNIIKRLLSKWSSNYRYFIATDCTINAKFTNNNNINSECVFAVIPDFLVNDFDRTNNLSHLISKFDSYDLKYSCPFTLKPNESKEYTLNSNLLNNAIETITSLDSDYCFRQQSIIYTLYNNPVNPVDSVDIQYKIAINIQLLGHVNN